MIAVDTNVLLRYLLQDDAVQSQTATRLILNSKEEGILVTDIVLMETYWVISQRNKAPRDRIAEALTALLSEPALRFENKKVLVRALEDYRDPKEGKTLKGKRKLCDFPDMVILHKAKSLEAAPLMTFDTGLSIYKDAMLPVTVYSP